MLHIPIDSLLPTPDSHPKKRLQNMKNFFSLSLIILLLTLNVACCAKKDAQNAGAGVDWLAGHAEDAARFAEIFPVSQDNPFIFAAFDEVEMLLKYGTGLVVFAFPACPRCKNAFPVLEQAFKEMEMDRHAGTRGKIFYYDIFEDRQANSERYLTLVEYLKEFLPLDANGNPRIYSPDVFFLAQGKIEGHHLDTVASLKNPLDPLNDEQKEELLKIYKDLLTKVKDCGC